jgi:tRNA-dihydrouridine synthase B
LSPLLAPSPAPPAAELPALQPLRLGSVEVWPPLTLAPMAGETGSVLRILARRLGAGLVCTELTSSHALYHRNPRSFRYLQWTDAEHPVAAQLFGADPDVLEVATEMCCAAGADLIDINMGCWVPKVAKTGAGASLLKDLRRAEAVMRAVVRRSSVPVTIKTRVGWDGCVGSAVEMARLAEDCGVVGIAIHGRTAVQGFTGEADWRPIAETKEAVRIPVIGNGDVRSPRDAARLFAETGCDAVMIGRAALGNPWLFREVGAYLLDGVTVPPPTAEERLAVCWEHAVLTARQERGGDSLATPLPMFARGQLLHYLHGLPGCAEARRRITQIHTLGDVAAILDGIRAAAEERA